MKTLKLHSFLLVCFLVAFCASMVAQSVPAGINYQAIANNAAGNPVVSSPVGIKISIYSGSASGTLEWEETHAPLTNQFGLFSIVIGQGTSTGAGSAASFSAINWGAANHYLRVSMDITGGTSYVMMDNSELLSVPYALYAEKSGTVVNSVAINDLMDVDTAGTTSGKTLKWNGTQWMPARDNDSDTAQFASSALNATNADTAMYAINATPSDTALFAYHSDSAVYATSSVVAQTSTNSVYADTATYALNCANITNDWHLTGNTGIVSTTNFIGTTNAADLVIKTNNTEKMRITSAGKLGVGTATPVATAHFVGADGLISEGTFGTGTIPATGAGTRMMWYPKKAAFRVGYVPSTQWDDANIGNYSYASGTGSNAKGAGAVAMGQNCSAGDSCGVSMGYTTNASGKYAVAMGNVAVASGNCAVAMGRGPTASGIAAQAIGYHVTASGDYSTAFGDYTVASGDHSTAMGYHANSNNMNGTFIFADFSNTAGTTLATAPNQFFVKASGGSIFYSNPTLTSGVSLAAGGGAWLTLSDRKMKEHFKSVDGESVLEKISTMDISSWNYKTQSATIRHIGPMAQDFYAAFKYGESDTTITSSDIDGVNLIGIQALAKRTDELARKSEEILDLKKQVAELKNQKADLEKRLTRIEETLRKNNTSVFSLSTQK